MPFGLMNAPSTFQRSVNTVLQGLKSFSGCYIDDIVIYSTVWEYLIKGFKEVLDRLRQFGLTAKSSKCVGELEKLNT